MAKDENAATEEGEKASRGRSIMLKHVKTGKEIKRADFIRERYAELESQGFDGSIRSQIVKDLKEMYNHEVPYQVVFQATKDKAKPKAAETTEA